MTQSDIELLKRAFACIDHTSLNPTDTAPSVALFAERAKQLCLPQEGVAHVASVCVWPTFVQETKRRLEGSGIGVACVCGGFPFAQQQREVKLREISQAVGEGADEVDVVLPFHLFFDTDKREQTIAELQAMREAIGGCTAKCIIESGLLKDATLIAQATQMVCEAGYDFVKTSTGKLGEGATVEAVGVMFEVLKNHKTRSGKTVGLKVSGGVSSPESALNYTKMAQNVIGEEYIDKQYFRIGTSRLTEQLYDFFIKECAHS